MPFPYEKYEPRPDDEFVITAYEDDKWAIVRKDDDDTTDADLAADPSKREVFTDKAVALARLRDLNRGDADHEFASQKSQQDAAMEAQAKDDERKETARQPPAKRAPAPAAPPPPPSRKA